ncbi:MAG TPA: Ldh family oxidoreductase [Desulfosporosinus sp.]|nr:Ldh family oxidoreductase [Desulfosporosinus sp.]
MQINIEKLKACAVDILIGCGENQANAELIANCMVQSDARGITTHGTYLLSPIYQRAQVGQLSLPTNAIIEKDDGATAIIDGGDGLGAVAGMLAVETGISKAKQYGVAFVTIKNTNNIGVLALYTERAASEGMIAIMSCNAAAAMAPWGAAEAFLGTNPFAISIHTGQGKVFSADMASSVVARGKIRKAARNGETIPDNWATDADGNFTTDPNAALDGALLPMGGPKGSAIGLTIDIMSGMLSGAAYAPNLKSFHAPEGKTGVGASLIVMDVARFLPLEQFQIQMNDYIESVKALKKAKGFNEIYMPGEIELAREQVSKESGVLLDGNAVTALNGLMEKLGLTSRLSEVNQ